MKPFLLALSILLLWNQIARCEEAASIKQGESFNSPDQQYIAKLVSAATSDVYPKTYSENPSDPIDCLQIVDKLGKSKSLFEQTFIYSLQWTGDSKTVVTVEPIAHGSECNIYHYANDKWKRIIIKPPDLLKGVYSVVKCDASFNTVNMTYKVFERPPIVASAIFYITSFVVDANTGAIARTISKKEINGEEYDRLIYKFSSSNKQ